MATIQERFWSKVDIKDDNSCWEWKGATYKNGYGAFQGFSNRQTAAHRIAYWLSCGEIPVGHVICHRCDNKLCVNPSHLFCGTQKDNMDDMWLKGRGATGDRLRHCPQIGELNHNSKITNAQVSLIREMYATGISQAEIARRLGVSRLNVWNIVHRKSWKHIE